jgi:hypothetical protein
MTEGRLRFVVFLYVFVALGYFLPAPTWSPVSRFMLTRAIVERGTFELGELAEATGDRARVGERYFSDKAPLPSLMAVPAYALVRAWQKAQGRAPQFAAKGTEEAPARSVRVSPAFRMGLYASSVTTAALSGALLAVALAIALGRRIEARLARLVSVGAVLGTPLVPYGASFFGHTMAAAGLFGAFVLVDPLARPSHERGRLAAAGLLLAGSVGCEYIVALPALFVAVSVLVWAQAGQRLRVLAWLALGAAPIVLALGAYHTACFGVPWRTGYDFIVHPAFAPGQSSGFFGITTPRPGVAWALLFGSARGLFVISPVSLVALLAGISAWRRNRDPGLLLGLLCFVVLWLVNASYFRWEGGWATGPRHMVPAFGFLGLGLGYAFVDPRFRLLAAAALGVSVVIIVLTTAVGLEAPPDQHALFDYLLPHVGEGRIPRLPGASNLGLLAGLSRRTSLVPMVLWLMLGAAVLMATPERRSPSAMTHR